MGVWNSLVFVTGSFSTAGGVSSAFIGTWNGSSWATLGSGLSATGFRVYPTATNVYVGGNFLYAGGILANAIGSWDGLNWVAIGTPGLMNGPSSIVRALDHDGTNLYVGGLFT